jgi:2-dehydro-3-deoxyphosphogluconate aldolase/(4S)-4-hydroxy-2-oxoglutarate aldolase
MEVTFRTAAAEAALLALKDAAIPGMCIGAGTVLTVEQAEAAIAAGSEFVISPGVNPEVVAYCVAHDVPVFPGIATPTDIQAAMNLGVDTLKFFPAEANGGIPTLSALAAVFSMIKFMPTGGITSDNIAEYLAVRDTRERLTHFTQIGLLLHSLCLPPIIALTCQ